MEFKLLGPVQLHVDDAVVTLRTAKRRGLLAGLLLANNEPVSREKLVEQMWDGAPHSIGSFRKYVTDLRAVLGADRLRHLGSGRYLLSVDPRSVDHRRFTSGVVAADAAIRSNRRSQAIGLLRSALAEWSGTALDGLPGHGFDTARDNLTAARRTAWTLMARLELDEGEPDRSLIDVRTARELWPCDDELFELEMRALAALSKPGEMTERYQGFVALHRRRGERPHARVADLYKELKATGGTRPRSTTPTAPNPQLLPAHTGVLIGRDRELATLSDLLLNECDSTGPVITVVGAPGIGKTSLALHWAGRNRNRFRDGLLYADLYGYAARPPAAPFDVLRVFLTALGVRTDHLPRFEEERANLFRALAGERRMLLVLDNAGDLDQVRMLLPGASRCATIITTRDRPYGLVVREGAETITLNTISVEDGLALLVSRIGSERVEREHGVATELISRCSGLPLAVSILAANAKLRHHVSLTTLLAELRSEGDRLSALSTPDGDINIRAIFTTSYHALSASAARTFRLIGLHEGPRFDTSTLIELLGTSAAETHAAVRELVDRHLLDETGDDEFTCHDLLRLFAAEQVEAMLTPAELMTAVRRIVDHYLQTAYQYSLMINPMRVLPLHGATHQVPNQDDAVAMAWFDRMHDNLIAAENQARSRDWHRECWLLPMTMAAHQWRRGMFAEAARIQQSAAQAAAQAGTASEQALVARTLANTYRKAGRLDQARGQLLHAISLCRDENDLIGEADGWQALATNHAAAGDLPEAAECYERASHLFEQGGDQVGLAYCLAGMAWLWNERGDSDTALQHGSRALALHHALSDHSGEAAVLDTLGLIHRARGDHAKAIECHITALRLYEEDQNLLNQATTLLDLGKALNATSHHTAARKCWNKALALFESMSHDAADEARRLLSAGG